MRAWGEAVRVACAAAVICLAVGILGPSRSSAQTPTPTPGGPCCTAHSGVACDDVACSNCVCEADEHCCLDEWDVFCAETDTIVHCPDECGCSTTPVPTPTPGGPCCSARDPEIGGTGCDAEACQACVCAIDSQCCTMIWDATCVIEASEDCTLDCPCGPLPTPTPTVVPTPCGDCCGEHGGAGCDDSTCQTCVCGVDDACCNNVWDADCVSEARVECALDCPCATEGDCCTAHDGIGCEDAECKDCVCGLDAACCTDGQGWDADCVDEANVECAASCTCEVAGSCCEDHIDTVGCDDRQCQACVCDDDPPCCTEGWDAQCADEAATNCAERCAASACEASCCETHGQPGCVDNACEDCVCGTDDFCCSQQGGEWDQGCLDIALGSCASSCQCGGGSCPGDCDDNLAVQINELIKCVNIALGSATLDTCPACDANGMNGVEINELVRAVNASLNGCP